MAGVFDHLQKAVDAADYNTAEWNDSGVTGYGTRLCSTRQFGLLVACDDNATALTAGWYSAIFGQALVGIAPAVKGVSVFGVSGECHLAVGKAAGYGDNFAGVYGYAEITAGQTYTANDNLSFSGVLAGIDMPSTAVIAANSVMSGLAIGAGTLGGTHTGKVAAIHITNPGTGTYDCLLQLGWAGQDATGIATTISVSNVNELTTGLKIRVAGVDMEIVCKT